MNFKVGDEVVVITGSDKGKKGKIIKTLRKEIARVLTIIRENKKNEVPKEYQ